MKNAALLVLIIILAGCSHSNIDDYKDLKPSLDLKTFFDGQLKAYGIVEDRSGKVNRRFVATIEASWQGKTGVLNEHFVFDDGKEEYRVWTLQDLGNGRYTGTADDVVGEAAGQIAGSVFQWQYQLRVPYQGDTIVLSLDDWLYLVDEQHLINRTDLTKFGFKVGELTLIIEKVSNLPVN